MERCTGSNVDLRRLYEVFDSDRDAGYHEWPRGCSTRDLAADLDVSKTTLLEHLRKAESKLLDPEDL